MESAEKLTATVIDPNRTICAISTPAGTGGIAVIRISGPQAFDTVQKIWHGKPIDQMATHTAHLGTISDTQGQQLDQPLLTIFRAPNTFTGQDTVELSVHGSQYIQQQTLHALTQAGAEIAGPGEFTMKACLNGRLSITQAEAIADIIDANSRAAHALATSQLKGTFHRKLQQLHADLTEAATLLELELDFSEEHEIFADRNKLLDILGQIHSTVTTLAKSFQTGQAIKNGIPIAIIGQTNAGKSSLLNALLDDDRAIVSDIHGTTRDTIEETITIKDYTYRLIDTAGIRLTDDPIEQIGISKSIDALSKANIILHITDPAQPEDTQLTQLLAQTQGKPDSPHIITVVNKTDIHPTPSQADAIPISALRGTGIETLKKTITDITDKARNMADAQTGIIITNARHATALGHAARSTQAAIDAINHGLTPDLTATHLWDTLNTLSTLTGQITSQDILTNIFSRFCIGK